MLGLVYWSSEARPGLPFIFHHQNTVFSLGAPRDWLTKMREVVYVQAGCFSNFTGTHFFNALESYFSFDDSEDERSASVAHDVSFREGITLNGTQTFCPRLLLFDHPSNFGPLPKISALYEVEDKDSQAW